jgi:hypothetical protein
MKVLRVTALAIALALPAASAFAAEDHEINDAMIESASTPAQHQAIADHYKASADAARKAATRHRAMAKTYAGGRMARSPSLPSTHCTKLADSYDAQAKEYDQLAAAHEAEAKK